MVIGYSYWGYLGDTKYDIDGNVASTPDGNAFYSWSIIYGLLKAGDRVIQVMPNRDYEGFLKEGDNLFSWCKEKRLFAYNHMSKMPSTGYTRLLSKEQIFQLWDNRNLCNSDIILHEWRMPIVGRNDNPTRLFALKDNCSIDYVNYQPDYFIQECLCEYCAKNNIPMIIFDLDYKLSMYMVDDLPNRDNIYIFELGNKWAGKERAMHVEIPFDFERIFEIPVNNTGMLENNIVYVGNRYERDWCIDKYVPTELDKVIVYGNWLESGRDSKNRWPNITFGKRLQTKDMTRVYNDSVCTLLLAKEEYTKRQFMTARIIESIFYGCVPLFIEEYGEECIRRYAGVYSSLLTVGSKSDVIERTMMFKYNKEIRSNVIYYLRERLAGFMDVRYFVDDVHKVIEIMNKK